MIHLFNKVEYNRPFACQQGKEMLSNALTNGGANRQLDGFMDQRLDRGADRRADRQTYGWADRHTRAWARNRSSFLVVY